METYVRRSPPALPTWTIRRCGLPSAILALPREHPSYAAFYTPAIMTSSLHFTGSLDTIIKENWTRELIAHRASGIISVAVHIGGHFVPAGKRELAVLVDFVCDVYTREEENSFMDSATEVEERLRMRMCWTWIYHTDSEGSESRWIWLVKESSEA
ncbi:hypothetical protein MBM_03138 [Drepanopeziza brunnea f. sp. 'multigermtubi' MB_m1]|uniref:Serine hydrolase domain-containing protein n=2 Tax=Drepanopeziza brunnea f. sp. 'multigermtubi' TaxID=698441 RepID=K1X0Z4_MARBU|nr:uncharacterized protein MBM_03138 [Drepanopeziza brunnea f. sp. 'multigermtubi' MB_m1]EKD18896.1 hypothetical protein MBM_03138 [Drepanopeziza brunnea f. sp. 'multigermtubi' MB_m1]